MTSSGLDISSSRPRAAKKPTHASSTPLTRPSVTAVWTVFVHALVVLCAKAAGSHNVCTQRKADKQVDQQVDERTVGANCCQRGAARRTGPPRPHRQH